MGEELGVDGKMCEQHDADVLLVDLEELKQLRDHVLPVKGHRQEVFFTATIATSVCAHARGELTRSTTVEDSRSGFFFFLKQTS